MIIITGLTKGIGRAVAEEFASKGYNLAGCARNCIELANLKQELETKYAIKCYFQSANLSQPQDLENFSEFVAELPEKPQALINNKVPFSWSYCCICVVWAIF
jgi:short-subunit dehydrogenase